MFYLFLFFFSRLVVSDCLQPHGLYSTRLPCPWDFPGKNTGVGCHFLLQGIFLTQGLNLGLLHFRQILYLLSHLVKYRSNVVTQLCPLLGFKTISGFLRVFASRPASPQRTRPCTACLPLVPPGWAAPILPPCSLGSSQVA